MLIVFSCIGGEKPPDVLLFFAEKRLKNSFFFLCFSVAKSSKKPLDVLFRLPEKTSEKTFFPAFRWRKAAKATRPIPMPASERLKAASCDYSRVCKQTVPAAVAFSPPSAFSPSEPSRESPCGKRKNGVTIQAPSLSFAFRTLRVLSRL